jgi:hypothetical protein
MLSSIIETSSFIPKIQKYGTQLCYSWADENGFHQYYTDMIGFTVNVGPMTDFQVKKSNNITTYSWNDKNGFHQYIL